jgi:3-oxoacyl-[acyl-carrier protein] reductase
VAYSATKGGVNAYTRALAKEVAPSGIRVNALACGCIDTDMNRVFTEEEKEALAEEIPLGRFARAEEVAEAAWNIMNLTYVTGQILGVDGAYL